MADVAMFPLIVTVVGGLGLVCAAVAYVLARRKRRNAQSWAFWGFLFPPSLLLLIMLPTAALTGRGGPAAEFDPEDNDDEGHDAEDDDGSAVNAATRQVTGFGN